MKFKNYNLNSTFIILHNIIYNINLNKSMKRYLIDLINLKIIFLNKQLLILNS